jgi:hypothetical protein
MIILACWNIWKQRNHWIFRHMRPSFKGWKIGFVLDVTMLKHRVKISLANNLSSWLSSLYAILCFPFCKYVVHSLNFGWVIKGYGGFPCRRKGFKQNICLLQESKLNLN